MRLGILVAVVAIAGCKQHLAATASSGSAAGTGSAAESASTAGSGSAVLAFDTPDAHDDTPDALRVAFHGKVLRLPAISADGALLADYDYPLVGEPGDPPYPVQLVLREVGSSAVTQTLPLLDDTEAEAAQKAGSAWQTPALTKALEARGDAIVARLKGFHSLEKVDVATDASANEQDVKLGALTLSPRDLELRDASGTVLHASELERYSTGSGFSICGYDPVYRDAFRDGDTLYIEVSYRYRDDCDAPPLYVYAWSLDPAKADPAATVRGLVAHQFEAVPAIAVVGNGPAAGFVDKTYSAPDDLHIAMARDGNAAWASMTGGTAQRASDVLVKTPKGWQLAAIAWTEGKDNAAVNRDAKAGTLHAAPVAGGPGDAALTDAFRKLTTDGVDAAAAKNDELVAIGSGPGEQTVGGAAFARAWNAAWKGKVNVVSSVATVAPSGTTGWVVASVELQKRGYKVPFLVFAVFDKDADGAWSLVHIHFAV